MPSTVRCPHCNKKIVAQQGKCPHCWQDLPPAGGSPYDHYGFNNDKYLKYDENHVEIYSKKSVIDVFYTLALIISCICIFGYYKNFIYSLGFMLWFLIAAMVLVIAIFAVNMVLVRRPMIRLTNEGIEFPRDMKSRIPWDELEGFAAESSNQTVSSRYSSKALNIIMLTLHLGSGISINWRGPRQIFDKFILRRKVRAREPIIGLINCPISAENLEQLVIDKRDEWFTSRDAGFAWRRTKGTPPKVSRLVSWTTSTGFILILAHAFVLRPVLLDREFREALLHYQAKDHRSAFSLFQKAANGGHALSANYLAMMYEAGEGVDQDYAAAKNWYEKAADYFSFSKSTEKTGLINGFAMYRIGRIYQRGLGVEKDLVKARNWYRRASENAYPLAAAEVGYMYERGLGGPRDLEMAEMKYKWAADHDIALGQAALAQFWLQQRKNTEEALALAQKAVAQKPDNAYFAAVLGWVLLNNGDYQEALAKLRRSVDLDPKIPQNWALLGDALLAVGNRMQAIEAWRRVLTLNPAEDDRKRTEQKLREHSRTN